MKFLKFIFSTIALISLSLLPSSAIASETAVADSLRSTLAMIKNPSDSLKTLLDIFDSTPQDGKAPVGYEILSIAERLDKQGIIEEFIPQLAILESKNEAKLDNLILEAEKINDRQQRKGVQLFVNVTKAVNEATYIPEEDFQKVLLKYTKADMIPTVIPTGDLYQDILDLYRVVIFLGKSAKSNLDLEYLTRLENMVNKLPEDRYYIKNMFYTTAALNHTQNGNTAKAIEADEKLLEIISRLEEKYRKQGRKFRKYDRYYYISYRRMLRNYRGLTLDQVKELYTKCAQLAEKDAEINDDFYNDCRPSVYRLMAEKQYADAIPYIQKAIDKNKDRSIERELYRIYVEAADSSNNKTALLEALKAYNQMLQERLDSKSEEAYRELHIRYDINNLKKENMKLEVEKRDSELASGQKLITLILSALLVLAVFLMLLYRRHFNLRRECHYLKEENKELNKNIEQLLDNGSPSGSVDVRDMKSKD